MLEGWTRTGLTSQHVIELSGQLDVWIIATGVKLIGFHIMKNSRKYSVSLRCIQIYKLITSKSSITSI